MNKPYQLHTVGASIYRDLSEGPSHNQSQNMGPEVRPAQIYWYRVILKNLLVGGARTPDLRGRSQMTYHWATVS